MAWKYYPQLSIDMLGLAYHGGLMSQGTRLAILAQDHESLLSTMLLVVLMSSLLGAARGTLVC